MLNCSKCNNKTSSMCIVTRKGVCKNCFVIKNEIVFINKETAEKYFDKKNIYKRPF